MIKPYLRVLALTMLHIAAAAAGNVPHGVLPPSEVDTYPAWRASAARTLAARGDAQSLAAAAALLYVGPASHTKADAAKAAALEFAVQASELAPDDAAISWLRLQICANILACDLRDAATTMRWVDADNGAAWLPTLATAQKDRDAVEVDRLLTDMAHDWRFDLYGNRTTVRIYDALKRVRAQLPANYVKSDLARLSEAIGVAGAAVVPSFSPLINVCREAATTDRRETCLVGMWNRHVE